MTDSVSTQEEPELRSGLQKDQMLQVHVDVVIPNFDVIGEQVEIWRWERHAAGSHVEPAAVTTALDLLTVEVAEVQHARFVGAISLSRIGIAVQRYVQNDLFAVDGTAPGIPGDFGLAYSFVKQGFTSFTARCHEKGQVHEPREMLSRWYSSGSQKRC